MQQFFGGFAVATLLAALGAGAYVYLGSAPSEDEAELAVDASCGGFCGEGTACEDGRCLVAEPEPADDGKRKRKRRRGGRRRGGAVDPEVAAAGFEPVDDSSVPRFKANADRTIDLDAGSERLSDRQVDAELRELDADFQGCVREAAKYADDLGKGKVSMSFGVSGSGKVTGVNARAPENLEKWGIVACVRKAVHGHRFPTFDGPVMRVESSFSVE